MLKMSWIAVVVLLADQLTKNAVLAYLPPAGVSVLPVLDFVLVHNSGAAFGFLSKAAGWQNVFFVTIAGIVSIGILYTLRKLKPEQALLGIALTLVLGGALGNLVDRLRFGYVIDFIDFHLAGWHWYVFNIADAAITIGAFVLALDAFGFGVQRKRPA